MIVPHPSTSASCADPPPQTRNNTSSCAKAMTSLRTQLLTGLGLQNNLPCQLVLIGDAAAVALGIAAVAGATADAAADVLATATAIALGVWEDARRAAKCVAIATAVAIALATAVAAAAADAVAHAVANAVAIVLAFTSCAFVLLLLRIHSLLACISSQAPLL